MVASGESNITNLWKKHFCNILNENTCDDLKDEIMAKPENIQHTDDMTVLAGVISQLKCGKAAGSDDLCAEYFSLPTINYTYFVIYVLHLIFY